MSRSWFMPFSRRQLSKRAATLTALGLLLVPFSPQAMAGETHIFEENFGSADEQSFSNAYSLAVHQSDGDVIVLDAGAQMVLRFKANGEPRPFSAFGTNAIDAVGPGADETPEGGFTFHGTFPNEQQLAVDNSGGPSDGNIYVTQSGYYGEKPLINIFSSSGAFLGQLTGVGGEPFAAENRPTGVAVAPDGAVFVSDGEAKKVYKYTPSINPPVNADGEVFYCFEDVSPDEELKEGCVDEDPQNPDQLPQEPGQLAAGAGATAGALFVADRFGKTFKLNSAGEVIYQVKGGSTKGVAVNPANGHVFVLDEGGVVHEYDASGPEAVLITSFDGPASAVAIEEDEGLVYLSKTSHVEVWSDLVVTAEATTTPAKPIGETKATLNGIVDPNGVEAIECKFEYGTTIAYGSTVPCAESPAEIGLGESPVHADVSGLAPETLYHFRLVAANVAGPADPQGGDLTFQTVSKPDLLGEWAEDVLFEEATLKAKINPQSAATTYRFEWGLTGAPYENSTADIAIGAGADPVTISLLLDNLQEATTYHFRLVAENHCHPETSPATVCTSTGANHFFTTYRQATIGICPNDALRGGPSAFLPDCRAYEMVSPVDKNGGDIVSELSGSGDPGGYVQAAPDGDRIAYTSVTAFGDQPNSFQFNEYLASRGVNGWASHGIHPPVEGEWLGPGIPGRNRGFIAFTPDLCNAWLINKQSPPITSDARDGYWNLFRRDNCTASPFHEALTTVEPEPSGATADYVNNDSVQGVSDDGRHATFVAKAKLTPEAPSNHNAKVYDRFDGELHLVSVGGEAGEASNGVGSGPGFNLDNAVSEDGERVYWTRGLGNSGTGKIYVREHPEQGEVVGECEADKACTREVSTGDGAFFWAAAADGSKALFTEGEELYEFDLATVKSGGEPRLVASHVKGVAGTSEDLGRFYFVSTDKLTDEAQATQPNLYLAEGEDHTFVTTLIPFDVGIVESGLSGPSVVAKTPYQRATRVSPDGSRIAFQSGAPLTGYDNSEQSSGEPAVEVFLYEAGGNLVCVSCNPSGGRPKGRELSIPYQPRSTNLHTGVTAAAWIPTWEHKLHDSNVLASHGNRLFFNSNDALLPNDTNSAQDVYEWEAPGTGGCTEADAHFFAENGGCIYLISSGKSPFESEFWEASPDGEDVFFTTASSLVPQDPGLVDLYDARVGGGFPPPAPPAECEGDACQSPPPPPSPPTPASSALPGEGNAVSARPRPPCPKGKRRVRRNGKARCVKRPKHHKRRAGNNRRAGR